MNVDVAEDCRHDFVNQAGPGTRTKSMDRTEGTTHQQMQEQRLLFSLRTLMPVK